VKRRKIYLVLVAVFALLPLVASGQVAEPSVLTLERIFSSRDFAPQSFGPARWVDGGTGYTTLEPSKEAAGGRDIIRYDTESGRREVLVPAARLVPEGASAPLGIEDYEWSSDGRLLKIYTSSERVWRLNTRGDYWIVELDTWRLWKLGGDAAPSTLMFAKFSPDGSRVSYVREHDVYVQDIASRRIARLTTGGSRTLINGTFDWVYEEEFGLRDGTRWSPDGKSIAYWQIDAEGVKEFFLINNTDSLYPRIIPIQYPKVGETLSAARVGIVSVDGGPTRWLEVPGDPRDNYIARMEWAGNSNEVVLQHLNRLQNTNQVMLGDAATGKVRTVLTERDEAWLDVVNDLQWFEGGQSFTWVSERDGWRHVYLSSRDGRNVRPVTKGSFDVIRVIRIDEKGVWLYFIASPDNAAQRYLFRSRLDGTGQPERLSPADQPGTHSYQISPDARWAFHTVSSFGTPPVTSLVRLPGHQAVRALADNAALKQKVSSLKRQPVEFFRIGIGGGVELDGWVMKPADMDPAKRYPLLMFVYGEPAGQTVLDSWGGSRYLWHLMLTQRGYVVASVDNRGTPGPRGRDWRKIVYRQIGILASEEQAAAVHQIAKWPFIDAARVGVWGWSGGGSMTLNAMFRYPDLYHTGISVAPVSDQRLYDAIYQERYMGLLADNEQGYRDGSPIAHVDGLKGNLLLIHGTGDDNVHYQSAEVVINEMIRKNRAFTMMAYPNRAHGISEGENTTRHLHELMTRYLETHLPAGPKN
jgi:dipeptidyl-peptidase 4